MRAREGSQADLLLRVTLGFLLVTAGFFAVTLYVETRLARSDPARDSMAENALPSIRHLSSALAELHRSEELTISAVVGDQRLSGANDRADAFRERRDADLQLYSALPYFPEEIPLFEKVKADLVLLDAATKNALSAQTPEEKRRTLGDLHLAGNRADVSLDHLIALDVTNAQALMHEVGEGHQQAERAVVLLDIVAAVLGVALAAAMLLVGGRLSSMRRGREELMQRRASELETFSARVAHDILSPLGAVSLALELAAREDTDQAADLAPQSVSRRHEILRRGQSSLARAREVVDALLDFARSGAQPKPGAASAVARVMDDVAAEARLTQPDFELTVDADPSLVVACATGVTTSLVSNLVNNALRYGGGAAKRITLRARIEPAQNASQSHRRAILEIEDAGPGLAPDMAETIFLPYVQGEPGSGGGLGLGLATVKRLAEAHGGACGVHSKPGAGCTFWVTLPIATGSPSSIAPPSSTRAAPSSSTVLPAAGNAAGSNHDTERQGARDRVQAS